VARKDSAAIMAADLRRSIDVRERAKAREYRRRNRGSR
jgi:hypothetical protein